MKQKLEKKKVCIITPMIYPVPAVKGGAVEGLVELLIRMNEKYNEMELTVVSLYDKEAEDAAKQYKKTTFVWVKRGNFWDKFWSKKIWLYANKIGIKLSGKTIFSMPFVKRAWKQIRGIEYDQYILEGGGDCYNFGYLHKKITPAKFMVHFHGEVEGDKAIRDWFGKSITVSNYIGRKLICNGMVSSSQLRVLPNCFDSDAMRSKASRSEIRNKYGLHQSDFVFIYWGRLIPEKGVVELLRAFEQVCSKIPEAKLLILGNANFGYEIRNEYDLILEKICKKPLLENRVIFTGFVNHDEMGSVLEACDIGVIPSIWDDPAPLTVFEGLSKGLPLIASRVGGIPEIITDNQNGCLINWTLNYSEELEKKMVELYCDKEKRSRLAYNAIESVNKYKPDTYYKNYLNIVREDC